VFESKILTTKDQKEWHNILDRFNVKDVNYLLEYLAIYEQEHKKAPFLSFGGQGLLYVFGDDRNSIIYPFFKRSISVLTFLGVNTRDLYDIVSPYGYGGPLGFTEDSAVVEELWRNYFTKFHIYCQENNIVSEFCRLHPFFENQKQVGNFSNGTIQMVGQIVYVDLSLSEDDLLKQISKGHRRKIRKIAKEPNILFRTDIPDNGPQLFFDIYTENMLRISANEKYLFSTDFFKAAFSSLDKNIHLWRICYKEDTCAAWIILTGGNIAYAWLSGSKAEYMRLNPNNILIYRSILRLKQLGFKYLIMGGGRSTLKDSLYDFKAGFSPLNKDFYVYKYIHIPKEYQRLIESQNYKGLSNEEFFPKYRIMGENLENNRKI